MVFLLFGFVKTIGHNPGLLPIYLFSGSTLRAHLPNAFGTKALTLVLFTSLSRLRDDTDKPLSARKQIELNRVAHCFGSGWRRMQVVAGIESR